MVSISKLLNNGLLLVDQLVYGDVATPQQASVELYNIINFLGGSGPYKQHPGFGISTDIPSQCKLQHVQMISRHAERFPSKGDGQAFEGILKVIEEYPGPFKGELEFLNNYEYFVTDKSYYEKETNPNNSDSPYTGVTNAYRHGTIFRKRYGELLSPSSILPVFTSNSGRCYETSKYFAKGLLGDDLSRAKFVIIDEDNKMGVNSLTPRYACSKFTTNQDKVANYDRSYLQGILDRLTKENPGLKLTTGQVNRLFLWCAFEINVRGSSPFCPLFTNDEFIRDAYGNDLNNYYSNGHGNPISKTIGAPLLEASLKLIKQHQSSLDSPSIYINFTHDTDLEMFLSTLGLVDPEQDLPIDHVPFPNPYNSADILPQSARLYTENFKCADGNSYVRYILNDAVIPLAHCQNGPGFSCNLIDFETYVNEKLSGLNFETQCGLKPGKPSKLTFYWDYKEVDYSADLIDQ